MNVKFLFYLSIVLLLLQGCGIFRSPIENTKNSEALVSKDILKQIRKNKSSFSKIRAKLKVHYLTEKQDRRVRGELRVSGNKKIWLSVNMIAPLAKVLVTPKKVYFYEKLNKTSYEGDFTFFNTFLQTKYTFSHLQNLFFGNPITDVTQEDFIRISHSKYYVLTSAGENPAIRETYFFDPKDFKLREAQLFIPQNQNTLSIKYDGYQRVGKNYFPTETTFLLLRKEETIKLTIEATKLSIPNALSMPFSIPKNYKSILF